MHCSFPRINTSLHKCRSIAIRVNLCRFVVLSFPRIYTNPHGWKSIYSRYSLIFLMPSKMARLKKNNNNCWSLAFGCASVLCALCGFAREICERNTCEWFCMILTFRYAESRIYPNIGAQDQPCVWRRELRRRCP